MLNAGVLSSFLEHPSTSQCCGAPRVSSRQHPEAEYELAFDETYDELSEVKLKLQEATRGTFCAELIHVTCCEAREKVDELWNASFHIRRCALPACLEIIADGIKTSARFL